MDFMLIYDWMDEDSGYRNDTWVEYYKTKEDLLLAKKVNESLFDWRIKNGSLILSPAVSYSWDEIDQLF